LEHIEKCRVCGKPLTYIRYRDAYTEQECIDHDVDPKEIVGGACFNPDCPVHPDIDGKEAT
jgi:hypothetical protein